MTTIPNHYESSATQTVLVIDDEAAVRTSFELALEAAPYVVRAVPDCDAGLAALAEGPVDLIFLDLKMPTVDGIETLRRLRAAGCAAPVYIITGFAEEFMRRLQQAAADGLDFELLQKPLELDAINDIVASALGETRPASEMVH